MCTHLCHVQIVLDDEEKSMDEVMFLSVSHREMDFKDTAWSTVSGSASIWHSVNVFAGLSGIPSDAEALLD